MRRRVAAAVGAAALLSAGAVASAPAHVDLDHGDALRASTTGAHAQILGLSSATAFGPVLGYGNKVDYVGGHNGFTGGHVAIEGKRMYLGNYGDGMRIYDVSEPAEPRQIGEYRPGLRADAPPDAAVYGDRHIAVLNGTRRTSTHSAAPQEIRTDRTEWLDVTDPANPVLLHTAGPDQVDGESHNGDIVDERRLYLPSGGSGNQGLRIYDISPLIDTPAEQCDGTPRVAGNPCEPTNIGRWNPGTLWENSPYRGSQPVGKPFTHTHDITAYTDYDVEGLGERDIILLAEGGNYIDNNGDSGSVFVIDITDPRNPVVLLRWLHERGAGHHPIRYHHEAQFLDGDPRLMLVTDEDLHNGCGGAGGIVAVRLSADLRSATEEDEWFIPLGTPAPVCSVHVFSSRNDTIYVGSYNAGLQVVEYDERSGSLSQVGEYIAEGTTAWGAQIYKRHVYVGDMSRGLDVFQYEGDRKKAKGGKGKGTAKRRTAKRRRR